MKYRLKATSPAFEAVDGPLAGKKFKHGKSYAEVPEGDKGRFEEVQPEASPNKATASVVEIGTSGRKGRKKPFRANSAASASEDPPPSGEGEGEPEEVA